jgi:uncharacterized membrane protein YphA (DoxX/SURF4 family)
MRYFYRAFSILRILIGAAFLFVGIQKLGDPEFLYGGLMHTLEGLGQPWPFYQGFLTRYVELHQTFFTFAFSCGEILLGVSFLLGAFVSISSVGGVVLLVNVALATSYAAPERLAAHLCGAALLLLMGRMGVGLCWGLDGWLVDRVAPVAVLFPLRLSVPNSLKTH